MNRYGGLAAILSRLMPATCLCCGFYDSTGVGICCDCRRSLVRTDSTCAICALPLPVSGVCGQCQRQRPGYTKVVAPFIYQHPLDRLVGRFKYRGDFAAGNALLQIWLAYLSASQTPLPELLIPLPLHWRRQWGRGFNQTIWLAKRLARSLLFQYDSSALWRCRYGVAQQALSRQQRLRNMRGSFVCRRELTGLRVVLLDDVVTTGATIEAASRALVAAGAASVDIWCLARTPLLR